MKKLFISQPMRGKTDEQIQMERGRLHSIAEDVYWGELEVIDSFFRHSRSGNRVKDLGRSIEKLSGADVAIFGAGWEDFDGCCIEHEVCRRYCIPMIEDVPNPTEEMTLEREAKILQDAIDTYGEDKQIDIAIEEMSELTNALLKYRRKGVYAGVEEYKAIMEEMADVGIMLNQLALIFGDCAEQEIAKLERLEKRIAEHG